MLKKLKVVPLKFTAVQGCSTLELLFKVLVREIGREQKNSIKM
jgi:hypothetical protein